MQKTTSNIENEHDKLYDVFFIWTTPLVCKYPDKCLVRKFKRIMKITSSSIRIKVQLEAIFVGRYQITTFGIWPLVQVLRYHYLKYNTSQCTPIHQEPDN